MTMVTENTNETEYSTTIEMIGPSEAHIMLAQHPRNRRLSRDRVNALTRSMVNGAWVFDGQPIRFDTDGSLVDGQHRLNALIAADMTLQFLVVRGVVAEAMSTMDTGKSRSFSDILTIEDPTLLDTLNLAAGCRILYQWERGARGRALVTLGNTEKKLNAITNNDLIAFFRKHREGIIDSVREAVSLRRRIAGVNTSALTLAVWVLSNLDDEDARFFFERIVDGAELQPGSPILALRKRLNEAAINRERIATYETAGLLFKTWNYYREGKAMQVLAWKQGGAHPEPFPEPK